jgi:hypothetical protein
MEKRVESCADCNSRWKIKIRSYKTSIHTNRPLKYFPVCFTSREDVGLVVQNMEEGFVLSRGHARYRVFRDAYTKRGENRPTLVSGLDPRENGDDI